MPVSDAARLATPEQFQAILGWFTALLAARVKGFPVLSAKQPEPELSPADALCLLLRSADVDAMGRSMTADQIELFTMAQEAACEAWFDARPNEREKVRAIGRRINGEPSRQQVTARRATVPPQRPAKPTEPAKATRATKEPDDGKCSHPRVACSPTKAKGKLLCRLCETEIDPGQRGD
jgi:hypothetical protein